MIRIGLLLNVFLLAGVTTGFAQNVTLNPDSVLRYTFNVNPSAWNSNTPDVIRLGVYGPAVISSTPPTLTAALYDGSTLLGTVSAKPLSSNDLPGLVSFYWRSPTSVWAEEPVSAVNFTSILNGSIQGRIDLSVSGGSVTIPPPVGDPGRSGFNCCMFMMYRTPAGTWDAIPGAVTNVSQLLVDQINVPDHLNFQISDRSGISRSTPGTGSSLQVGFARIVPNEGSTTPSGVAIFHFTKNGVVISEAAVPASPLIQSGRTYAEIAGAVDTAIAIANPTNQDATITFYYTDAAGANVLSGTTTVTANSQISAFLNQAPFVSKPTDLSAVRTFTLASSVPVGVTAVRGYTNERGEFLITTLPVTPINTTSTTAFAFPLYADGGGWASAVVLINPTDSIISGTAQFYSNGTTSTPGAPVNLIANGTATSSFSYMIQPRAAFKLQTAGTGSAVQTGWVKVTPNSGTVAPSGLVVFSSQSKGVRVSEAAVPALSSSTAFRTYAEASGSIQTGIAVSNPSSSNVTVSFDLTNLDGTSTGITGSTTVPATGQIAMFLNQIPGFSGLPASFKGILRVSSANVFVAGIRGRYNERGDFLITTTTPVNENAAPSSSQWVFPQLVDGAGYTTQFILFSGTSGQFASGVLQFSSQSGQPLHFILH